MQYATSKNVPLSSTVITTGTESNPRHFWSISPEHCPLGHVDSGSNNMCGEIVPCDQLITSHWRPTFTITPSQWNTLCTFHNLAFVMHFEDQETYNEHHLNTDTPQRLLYLHHEDNELYSPCILDNWLYIKVLRSGNQFKLVLVLNDNSHLLS